MDLPTPSPPSIASTGPRRVALVTGATGGLGASCATALAARGDHVVVADLDGDLAERLAAVLRDDGGSAEALALDVCSRSDVDAAVGRIVAQRGGLAVLVNLAGIIRNAVVVKIDDADFAAVMAVHVQGTLNTMRAALPEMRRAGYGRVVNTSSIALRGSIAGGSYGAAKGAIEGLSRSAAMEVAKHGVTVNCVAPGLINAGVFLTVPEDYQRESMAGVPMGRPGEPAEVAACVAFLASPEAGYVTGQTLTICGGLSLGF